MAIASCGFPPVTVVGVPPNFQLVGPVQMLHLKGPTLAVEIGFDASLFNSQSAPQLGVSLDPAQAQATGHPQEAAVSVPVTLLPQASLKVVEALLDTGARESCIDENLARELNLPLIDQADGSGIGGTEKFNVYLGHIRIIGLNFTQFGRFMGVKLSDGGQPHHALLGRSVLQNMILVYDGRTGTASLAV